MPLNFPSAPTLNTTYSFNSKTWTYTGNAWALSTGGSLNTSVVPEGSNLYFSNARVYSNVSQLGYITSSSLSGYATNTQLGSYATNAQLALYATTSNVALKANIADLTAANITGTTLNSSIVNSSLTSVGTLGSLTVTNNVNSGAILTTGNSTAANYQSTGNVNTGNLRVTTNSTLGTVVSGTWNGASITTAYTDAKVTSVNGQVGAATGFATTANSLSQFASTTSAQLATLISDETGSGVLVFGTSPAITTSLTTPSTSFDLINTTATTVNFAKAATTLSIGASTGTTTVNNGLVVTGDLTVNGTTTTVNATTITVDDKNIELGSVASPTDVTAEGGGITLKGATDKTLNWVGATAAWTSSEDFNLLTGKAYEINGTSVLNSTTLGSGVVNSSLTSVGTLGSLAVTNNVSAGAYLTSGSSTAGTFQTAGNVNSNNLRVVTASSLGTVQSGTWNGSSISTTYTDAKVVSVNGSTGAVTGLATTSGTLAQFGATTSAQLLGVISDETGSGSLVFATSPTLVTPVIGAATGTSLSVSGNIIVSSGNSSGNGLILSDDGDIVDMNDGFASIRFSSGVKIKSAKYSSTDAITLASTGTLTATGNVNSASLRVTTASSLGTVQSGTWNGSSIGTAYTDAKVTSVNGSTGAITGLATTAGTLAQFGATTSAQLLGVISDETGSGALVFATSPTLVTPALGTPASGTLTNCTFPTLNQNTTGSAGSVTGLTLNNSGSAINPDNVTQNQLGYNTNISLFGQTDGGLYSSAYSSSWIHQIYGDFRSGQIAIRGKNSGTWQSWRTVLDSTNYTSYAPTLTGTGASGT